MPSQHYFKKKTKKVPPKPTTNPHPLAPDKTERFRAAFIGQRAPQHRRVCCLGFKQQLHTVSQCQRRGLSGHQPAPVPRSTSKY